MYAANQNAGTSDNSTIMLIVGIAVVGIACLAYTLYTSNNDLTAKDAALRLSITSLTKDKATLTSDKATLTKDKAALLVDKATLSKQISDLGIAHQKALADLKARPDLPAEQVAKALALLSQSTDTLITAILLYHDTLNRPELKTLITYYLNALKAIFTQHDAKYKAFRAQLTSVRPSDLMNTYMEMCNNIPGEVNQLYSNLIGNQSDCGMYKFVDGLPVPVTDTSISSSISGFDSIGMALTTTTGSVAGSTLAAPTISTSTSLGSTSLGSDIYSVSTPIAGPITSVGNVSNEYLAEHEPIPYSDGPYTNTNMTPVNTASTPIDSGRWMCVSRIPRKYYTSLPAKPSNYYTSTQMKQLGLDYFDVAAGLPLINGLVALMNNISMYLTNMCEKGASLTNITKIMTDMLDKMYAQYQNMQKNIILGTYQGALNMNTM